MSDEERLRIVGGQARFLLLQRKYQQLLQLGQRSPTIYSRLCRVRWP